MSSQTDSDLLRFPSANLPTEESAAIPADLTAALTAPIASPADRLAALEAAILRVEGRQAHMIGLLDMLQPISQIGILAERTHGLAVQMAQGMREMRQDYFELDRMVRNATLVATDSPFAPKRKRSA